MVRIEIMVRGDTRRTHVQVKVRVRKQAAARPVQDLIDMLTER